MGYRSSLSVVTEQVEYAVDFVLGGYENSIADGNMTREDVPNWDSLIDEIYSNITTMHYGLGYEAPQPRNEVIRADETLLRGLIDYHMATSEEYDI